MTRHQCPFLTFVIGINHASERSLGCNGPTVNPEFRSLDKNGCGRNTGKWLHSQYVRRIANVPIHKGHVRAMEREEAFYLVKIYNPREAFVDDFGLRSSRSFRRIRRL